jgi:hypothetical protein
MRPSTRQELITYCKRQLGAPVITINVSDDQVEDCVDDAIQFYQEYHADATVKHYRKHTITSDDVTNKYIDIPEDIIFLTHLLPFTSSTKNMFSIEYQMHLNDLYNLRNPGSIINYEMTQQYMSLLNMTFDTSYAQTIRFNRHMNRVFVDAGWGTEINDGDILVFECYSTVNPSDYPDVYNDMFLKRYLTALIKKQWGSNTKKFSGMQLPGGVEITGQDIFDEAKADLEKLEEEMSSRYSMPPIGFVG